MAESNYVCFCQYGGDEDADCDHINGGVDEEKCGGGGGIPNEQSGNLEKHKYDNENDVLGDIFSCLSPKTLWYIRLGILIVSHTLFHIFMIYLYIVTGQESVDICRARYEHVEKLGADPDFVAEAEEECNKFERMVWTVVPMGLVPFYIVMVFAVFCLSPVQLSCRCCVKSRPKANADIVKQIEEVVKAMHDRNQQHFVAVGPSSWGTSTISTADLRKTPGGSLVPVESVEQWCSSDSSSSSSLGSSSCDEEDESGENDKNSIPV